MNAFKKHFIEDRFEYALLACSTVLVLYYATLYIKLVEFFSQNFDNRTSAILGAVSMIAGWVLYIFYRKLYDVVGFKMSSAPAALFMLATSAVLILTQNGVFVVICISLAICMSFSSIDIYHKMYTLHIPKDHQGVFKAAGVLCHLAIPIAYCFTVVLALPAEFAMCVCCGWAIVYLICLKWAYMLIRHGHYDLHPEDEEIGWNEYPRPLLKRDSFLNLNGIWDMNGSRVLVPFAPQSRLSGFKGHVPAKLHYSRRFTVPEGFMKDRLILNFGAVDQKCEVFVNGTSVGKHIGGYIPFGIDITEAVNPSGENEISLEVIDRLEKKYPYGKQSKDRGGMWYTPVSGIWKTVWLESVPANYITGLKLNGTMDGKLSVSVEGSFERVRFETVVGGREFSQEYSEKSFVIDFSSCDFECWSPDNPKLYDVKVTADGSDMVESYFAFRTVDVREINGQKKICLNGKPIFIHAVLDQGYFCEGIYTPANERAYITDIENMKELGFNMLRKHIKIEPECFYYECDRRGMLVMQDMVNNGLYSFLFDTAFPTVGKQKIANSHLWRTKLGKQIFKDHMLETLDHCYSHPSIVAYTIFNEGWGQFDSDEMYELAKGTDPSRIYDATSGWFTFEKSDVESIHIYLTDRKFERNDRPHFLAECGGYSLPVAEHLFSRYNNYGYGTAENDNHVTDMMIEMYERLIFPRLPDNLCGYVYTQISDVEDETNGLYTYDRKVCKVDKERVKAVIERINAEL